MYLGVNGCGHPKPTDYCLPTYNMYEPTARMRCGPRFGALQVRALDDRAWAPFVGNSYVSTLCPVVLF